MTPVLPRIVWLVEDHATYRRTVQRIIERIGGFCCPQAFDRSEDCLAALEALAPPDILLLDVGLPGLDGIRSLPMIKQLAPQTQVIVLTVFDDQDKIFRAICEGASGYLLKTASQEEIGCAIREVLAGGAPMSATIAHQVLGMFKTLARPQGEYGLTAREKQILELLVQGLIKKEIAQRLALSVHTVDSHVRSIYDKLQVHTRTGAVSKAVRENLCQPRHDRRT
jgi:DNA-binding NarL/FixJ family response regulator